MIIWLYRIRRDSRGQAIVEMALVLPIFILLVMGIIDFGRLLNAQISITHASREGARQAALGAIDSEVTALVKGVAGSLDPDLVTVSISREHSAGSTAVTVSVGYRIELITPIIGSMLGGTRDLTATTVMRAE